MFTAPTGEPQKLEVTRTLPTSLHLKWSPPELKKRNGKIIGYRVSWRLWQQGKGSSSLKDILGTTNVSETIAIIINLNVSTAYEVRVAAFTAVGIGPSASTTVTTTNSKLEGSRFFDGFTVG